MRYASAFSGIGTDAVAWHPLGWECAWFAETDKFPCEVLRQRFPDVPNLGDVTKIGEEHGPVDLLVGGPPCQDFSVAGKRKGIDGARGNMILEFLALAKRIRARWIVIENVPGLISSGGGRDFKILLDEIENLGYIIDVDILDAQFFGVPQRRRRVFICGQSVDSLLSKTTPTSALTIAQCLVEILHGTLIGLFKQLGSAHVSSESLDLLKDGAQRRMKLFGLLNRKGSNWLKSREILTEILEKFPQEQKNWELPDGASQKKHTTDALLTAFFDTEEGAGPCLLTEGSLRSGLDDAYGAMKSFTTSTATSSTTTQEISICLRAFLLIGKLIFRLRRSCPCSWSAGSSFLTAMQEITNYARQVDECLFVQLDGFCPWGDFLRETGRIVEAVRNLGDEPDATAFLFEREGLRGNPPKGKKTGEDIAGTLEARASTGGYDPGAHGAASGHLVPMKAATLTRQYAKHHGATAGKTPGVAEGHLIPYQCHGGNVGPVGTLRKGNGNVAGGVPFIAHSLRGEGFDASEDGTGRGTPIIVEGDSAASTPRLPRLRAGCGRGGETAIAFSCKDHGADAGESSPTLRSMGHNASHANAGGQVAVAYATHQYRQDSIYPADRATNALAASSTRIQQSYDTPYGVRRLTPVECERLQGLEDNHTRIAWRGKPPEQCPDGPRYRAIGNGMAMPVLKWLGQRIQMVEDMINGER